MSQTPELDSVRLTLKDGFAFELWESVEVSKSFLDPCQTMRLTVGADETRFGFMRRLRKGSEFRLDVNDAPVLGGFLDAADLEISHEGGVQISITGRDILSPVVDSNVDPGLPVKKGMSLMDLAQLLFTEHFRLPFFAYDDLNRNVESRNKALGRAISAKPKKGRQSARAALKEIYPRANEGGFQFFSRFAHRVGYHAWAQPDGQGIIIGTPTYDQEPAGELRLLMGAAGRNNNIVRARIHDDNTAVPSHVYVRGKGAKPGDKSTPLGFAVNKAAPFFKPFYITDDEASTQDHADAVARYILGKALRTSFSYEVTVRGLSAPQTGCVYTPDTVLRVQDEFCGVSGLMWVESRTLRKSRQGTSTTLNLIPADSLLLDYYVADAPPPPVPYDQAAGQVGQGAQGSAYDYPTALASGWFKAD